MRTIQFIKDKDKIIRKAKETMEIYAPLADRMGMNRIRDELEDLSFEILNPEARHLVKKRLDEIKKNWIHPKNKQKIDILIKKLNPKSISDIKIYQSNGIIKYA